MTATAPNGDQDRIPTTAAARRPPIPAGELRVGDRIRLDWSATCDEVYDYALGNLTVTCQEAQDHEGPHQWTGNDNMPNRVVLMWEPVSV